MECNMYREQMSLWLDGQLTDTETERLDAHTATCPACRAAFTQLRRVDWLLTDAPMIAPAPGFAARFEAKLAARRRRHRTWAGFVILLLASLAVMLALASLVAVPGLTLWESISTSGLLPNGVSLILDLGKASASLLNVAWLILSALAHMVRHPVFIAYVLTTAILLVVWTQIVARRVFAYGTVTA